MSSRRATGDHRTATTPDPAASSSSAIFKPTPPPMADAFVYGMAWKATVITAVVVLVGLLAAVAVMAMRSRRSQVVPGPTTS